MKGGTVLTEKYSQMHNKPLLKINIMDDIDIIRVNFNYWIEKNSISTLNIAGQRESDGCIYQING